MRSVKSWSAAWLIWVVLTAVSLTVGGTALAQPDAPTQTEQPTSAGSLEAVRQAYELLLDRFVHPLEPYDLLAPAWNVAALQLRTASDTADLTPPTFDGNRFDVWKRFSGRVLEAMEEAGLAEPSARLTYSMIRAMAAAANEAHTGFRTPEEYQEHLAWQRNDVRYQGIGVRFRGRGFLISEVFEGSPAQAAGLRMGDQILAVDGVNIEGADLEEGRRRIRGPAGSLVELLIRRPSLPEPLTVLVMRDEIKIDFVRFRVLEGNIGYILLLGFPEPSVFTDVDNALQAFAEQDVRGVILDMRGNSGGRLDVGTRIASKFIKDGAVFQQIDRSGRHRPTTTTGSFWEHDVPLAVLVDGGTASMGEIVASAIRENDAGVIIGSKTAGVVSAAQIFPLIDGSAIQITILEILSGKGEPLNIVGVTPEVNVDFTNDDLQAGRDPQLERAVSWIRTHDSTAKPPAPRALLERVLPEAA